MKLEALLHYCHVTCGPAVAGLDETSKAILLTNIDTVATETFISCKKFYRTLNKELLDATVKYWLQIKEHMNKDKDQLVPSLPPASETFWIDFPAVAEKTVAGAVALKEKREADAVKLPPQIICFDEGTGAQLTSQATASEAGKEPAAWIPLPWKEWLRSAAAQDMAAAESDMAAAIIILRRLHADPHAHKVDVNMLYCEATGKKKVVCGADIAEGALQLPPCIPKSNKLHQTSIHESRVPITVERKNSNGLQGSSVCRSSGGVTNTYYIHPEFKMPSDDRTEAHMMKAPMDPVWEWNGDETMHPYWAVRRLTEEDKEKATTKEKPLAFNTTVQGKTFYLTSVGDIQGNAHNLTIHVTIPMITNTVPIKEGEELILEVAQKKKKRMGNGQGHGKTMQRMARPRPRPRPNRQQSRRHPQASHVLS